MIWRRALNSVATVLKGLPVTISPWPFTDPILLERGHARTERFAMSSSDARQRGSADVSNFVPGGPTNSIFVTAFGTPLTPPGSLHAACTSSPDGEPGVAEEKVSAKVEENCGLAIATRLPRGERDGQQPAPEHPHAPNVPLATGTISRPP